MYNHKTGEMKLSGPRGLQPTDRRARRPACGRVDHPRHPRAQAREEQASPRDRTVAAAERQGSAATSTSGTLSRVSLAGKDPPQKSLHAGPPVRPISLQCPSEDRIRPRDGPEGVPAEEAVSMDGPAARGTGGQGSARLKINAAPGPPAARTRLAEPFARLDPGLRGPTAPSRIPVAFVLSNGASLPSASCGPASLFERSGANRSGPP